MVYSTNKLKEGALNHSIPSTFADNAATSSIGTKKDQSKKGLCLNRTTIGQDVLHAMLGSGGGNSNRRTPL
jgi:hypothetical protein